MNKGIIDHTYLLVLYWDSRGVRLYWDIISYHGDRRRICTHVPRNFIGRDIVIINFGVCQLREDL